MHFMPFFFVRFLRSANERSTMKSEICVLQGDAMRKQIEALRTAMKAEHVDAYLVPTTDFHGSEYVNPYFKCREYLSGFTGSAGTLLVTADWAGLWTDGRYFLQADAQLSGSGIELMKEREPGVPTIAEYLEANLPEGRCLGFDGRVLNCREAERFAAKYLLRTDLDLAGDVWPDRPELKPEPIYAVSLDVTGETAESKLVRLKKAMKEAGAAYHLTSCLEEIAWLYNLRGNDVKHTPVFFGFLLVEENRERLYVLDDSFTESDAASELPKTTEIWPYFQIFEDVKKLPAGKILLDKGSVSHGLASGIPPHVEILDGNNPSERMKAVKNHVEIAATRQTHVKDGAAMVQFIKWIKDQMAAGTELTEMDAAEAVESCRMQQEGYQQPSFDTIAGYGANGAIVHYSATSETNAKLNPEGFLLVDSGGQYADGTTDITRTIALGPLTDEMKVHYTLVLKGHIALAMARFDRKTTGAVLDELARKPLKEHGLNYNHGTGHGVGHLLSVHEGPNSISPRAEGCTFLPGMITSDEPGIYLEGRYGIRLENEVLCVEDAETGVLYFEPLTWCPWERAAILKNILSTEEIAWVDQYHANVYRTLKPYLNQETADWLEKEAAPL